MIRGCLEHSWQNISQDGIGYGFYTSSVHIWAYCICACNRMHCFLLTSLLDLIFVSSELATRWHWLLALTEQHDKRYGFISYLRIWCSWCLSDTTSPLLLLRLLWINNRSFGIIEHNRTLNIHRAFYYVLGANAAGCSLNVSKLSLYSIVVYFYFYCVSSTTRTPLSLPLPMLCGFRLKVYRNKPSREYTGRSWSSISSIRNLFRAFFINCMSARRRFLKQKKTVADGDRSSRSERVVRRSGKAGSK